MVSSKPRNRYIRDHWIREFEHKFHANFTRSSVARIKVCFCGYWEGLAPANRYNNTSWITVAIPAGRPKSVRNCCVIEVFGGNFCVVTLLFLTFC